MGIERATIILPLPAQRLSPNCPVGTGAGRIAKAAATKRYREQARSAAERVRLDSIPWRRATARLTFYWPTKRRRDVRNAEHMMKPAYDGIVDAGIIPDDSAEHLTHHPTRFDYDSAHPRVEIEMTRSDEA